MLKTIREVFAHNLREMRGKRTRDDLADAVGIPGPSYRDMESGVIPKKWKNIEALVKFYNVPETRFFLDPDLIPPPPPTTAQLFKMVEERDAEIERLRAELALKPAEKPTEKQIERIPGKAERLAEMVLYCAEDAEALEHFEGAIVPLYHDVKEEKALKAAEAAKKKRDSSEPGDDSPTG